MKAASRRTRSGRGKNRLDYAVIETQSLGKTYGRGLYALRDLNLKIDKGEFVFLTGPSGAGKSTLLRLLLLEERPTEGEVDRRRPQSRPTSRATRSRRTAAPSASCSRTSS